MKQDVESSKNRMIFIYNRRTSLEKIQQQHRDALILDVTSRGEEPWIRFSPFYPHGGIPVPFSPGLDSISVEGIWQGLKVFERCDIDMSKFTVKNMKGLKRSSRVYGQVLGHRKGIAGPLLGYIEARHLIYLPTYRWVLEHHLQDLVTQIRNLTHERGHSFSWTMRRIVMSMLSAILFPTPDL